MEHYCTAKCRDVAWDQGHSLVCGTGKQSKVPQAIKQLDVCFAVVTTFVLRICICVSVHMGVHGLEMSVYHQIRSPFDEINVKTSANIA